MIKSRDNVYTYIIITYPVIGTYCKYGGNCTHIICAYKSVKKNNKK